MQVYLLCDLFTNSLVPKEHSKNIFFTTDLTNALGWHRELTPGLCNNPEGWEGHREWEGGDICIPWLIYAEVWQKPTQYHKAFLILPVNKDKDCFHYYIKMCFAFFILILPWVQKGIFQEPHDMWYRNRLNAKASMKIQPSSMKAGIKFMKCETMTLFSLLFYFRNIQRIRLILKSHYKIKI